MPLGNSDMSRIITRKYPYKRDESQGRNDKILQVKPFHFFKLIICRLYVIFFVFFVFAFLLPKSTESVTSNSPQQKSTENSTHQKEDENKEKDSKKLIFIPPKFKPETLSLTYTVPIGIFRSKVPGEISGKWIEFLPNDDIEKGETGNFEHDMFLLDSSIYKPDLSDKGEIPVGKDPDLCLTVDKNICLKRILIKDVKRNLAVSYLSRPREAGLYNGKIRFSVTNTLKKKIAESSEIQKKTVNGRFEIPFTLKVKHDGYVPALTILAGLVLGWLLTWYRKTLLGSDELYLRIKNATEGARDAGFKPGDSQSEDFWNLIKEARVALALIRADAAQVKVEEAENWLINQFGNMGSVIARKALESSKSPKKIVQIARKSATPLLRLRIFRIVSYAIALGLLGYVGFEEFYTADEVFGNDGFADYITLFVWGFGAQATSQAIGQMVKSWGLPGSVLPG